MNEYLISGNCEKYDYISHKLDKPNFVMLLDSDSQIGVGGVKSAINAMLHPLSEKYDLLTFGCSYRLSSLSTLYSKRFSYSAGTESYCAYSDFYYNLCGKSIYCGKGIYRLEKYEEKLKGVLPEGKILSHDIIEGAILNTGSLNQSVYEDAPRTFVADTERKERWMRGDLLLLPHVKKASHNDAIYAYTIMSNFFAILRPIALMALYITAIVVASWQLIIPIILSGAAIALIEIGYCVLDLQNGIRLRYFLKNILTVIWRCLDDILLTPYYAVQSLWVCAKTAIKSIFKTDLLQWKTFRNSQKGKGVLRHIREIIPFVIFMTALSAVFMRNIGVAIYSLSCVIYANALCFAMAESKKRIKLRRSERAFLYDTARSTYRYFTDMRSENMLICDNYQFEPMQGANNMTSPTNLGMLLLSHVCAAKLGIIDNESACEAIFEDIEKIYKLPRWKGHLFNWYDVNSGEVKKPAFVSGVDSGNFIAACLCVQSYLNENEVKSDKLDELIVGCELNALFDVDTGQYYIGYNCDTDTYEGHYDMLASEARTLAYIGACFDGNTSGWNNLARRTINIKGNALVSWGGTAFEYLMPQLFFKEVGGSLISLSCERASKVMRRNKCLGLYGVSESGYYELNDSMHYKYSQFGISTLALKADADRCIIAPYAGALTLKYMPHSAVKNMKKLVKRGVYGKYGLCEAIDFTAGGEIVCSYMSHHQGMILASITNALCYGYIEKLFCENNFVAGGSLMLEERMPTLRSIAKPKADFVYSDVRGDRY
ncbi:MAG: hypothetical protein K2I79_04635, partial [Clostridia bacterium]|nr:hypothetical protein [Clostridia bacterium]